MAELTLHQEHLATLNLPYLVLEIFADPVLATDRLERPVALIERVWSRFRAVAEAEGVFEAMGIDLTSKVLEVDLTWTGNEAIHVLNRAYREKDEPTDVLTFTLMADAPEPQLWLALPVIQLGSIFISVDWAEAAVRTDPALNLERYLLERFVHGLLHLLGQHHDTMPEYERVVRIQRQVLDALETSV